MSVLTILNSIYDDEKKKREEEEKRRREKEENKFPIDSMLFFYNEEE